VLFGVFFKSALFFILFRLQNEGSDDRTHSLERLSMHVKSEEEHRSMHVKGESTESELEEEDDEVIQLRESEEEERGSYMQVCV